MPVGQESLFFYSQLGRKTGNKVKLLAITLAKQKRQPKSGCPCRAYSVESMLI